MIKENDGKTCRILAIDAWRDPEGGWTWNSWHAIGEFDAVNLDYSARKLLKWFRDEGFLSAASPGKCAVDDDQYNIVIVDRANNRPLYAIEYGHLY